MIRTVIKLSEFIYILNLCIIDFLIIFKILKIEINDVQQTLPVFLKAILFSKKINIYSKKMFKKKIKFKKNMYFGNF